MKFFTFECIIFGLFFIVLPLKGENIDQVQGDQNALKQSNTELESTKARLKQLKENLIHRLYEDQLINQEPMNKENDSSEEETNYDGDLSGIDKRYRLMGKRYRLMGKRYRLMGKRYRLMNRHAGKREFELDSNEDNVDNEQNETIEKRYRLMGKRYRLMG